MSARRLRRGLGANALSIAIRIALQFATLPLLFAAWPAGQVGVWLMLFALPAYVGIVGTGFAGAGGSESLAAAQAADMPRARRLFVGAWAVTSAGTIALALAFLAGGEALARLMPLAEADVATAEIGTALGWLALYIVASSQLAVADIPFRVAGRYPDHILLTSLAGLAEIVIIAFCALLSGDLAVLAMGLALGRTGMAALTIVCARRAAPDMFAGSRRTDRRTIGALWRPSLAFMAMPVIFGLNLQGYLLLAGARFGAVALAAFAATRTLTRMLDLLINLAYGLHYYESGYLSDDRTGVQRRILATTTAALLVVALAFAAALLATGHWLQPLYTGGQTRFDPALAAVLLAAAGLRALAAAPLAVLAAENRHGPTVAIYLAGSLAGLAGASMLAAAGAPLVACVGFLVLAEAAQTIPALGAALRHLGMTPAAFARAVISRDRLGDLAAMIRMLRRPA